MPAELNLFELNWLYWALVLPGPLLALWGSLRLGTELFNRARRTRTEGRVTAWHGTQHLNPVIAFTTHDGREVSRRRIMLDLGIHTARPVTVWYDPARPERFSWQLGWMPPPGLVPLLASLPFLWLLTR